MSSSFTFSGYTWSSGDKIYFYPWISSQPDGYAVGAGTWAGGALFSATSGGSPASVFSTNVYGWTTTASIQWYFW